MEKTARRLARISGLLLVGSGIAYALSLAVPALTVAPQFARGSWSTTVTGGETLLAGARAILRGASGLRTHASAMHYALGALNLIPVAALALWKLKGRRFAHVVPLVLVVAAFAVWAQLPSSPEEVDAASEVWVLRPGYFIWLWALAGMSVALGLQWKSRAMLDAIWSRRASAKTSGWTLHADKLVHLSPEVRSLCHGAQGLRRSLENSPLGDDATREAWEWRKAAAALSEVDRTMLRDHNIQLEDAESAMERFWDADAGASLGPLAEMDAALDHFLATATAPPKFTAFR